MNHPTTPRTGGTTHTLTNPDGTVWILATARGQVISTVTAADVAAAAGHVGPLGDDSQHRWVRRGPGRYSRIPIATGDPTAGAHSR